MIAELKTMIRNMSIYERIGSVLFFVVLLGIQAITDSSILSFICTALGIVYVLGVKYQARFGLLVGAIQTFIYAMLAFNNKVFGDFSLNTYTCITLIIGFVLWKKNSGKIEVKKAKSMDIAVIVISTIAIYISLFRVLNSVGGFNPYLDAFNTTMSIVALILTMYRYRCAWVYWNLNNISSLILYITLYLSGANVAPMILMFTAYTINSLHATSIWYSKKTKVKQV